MLRVVLTAVYIISGVHIFLGILSVCLGVVSSIRSEVWLAHSVSPIWSGGFVSMTDTCLLTIRDIYFYYTRLFCIILMLEIYRYHSSQLRLIPYLHHTSSVFCRLIQIQNKRGKNEMVNNADRAIKDNLCDYG